MKKPSEIRFGTVEAGLLMDWYRRNGVRYPWTGLSDPWAVWVSEVMLQQTTVHTVSSRFSSWMDRYPDPAALADAPEDEFLREWEGLGYYNRVRNLASAAAEVTCEFGGRIPGSSRELRQLPGVGPYIASAVASFAFGEPVAAIEANGRRIAMRLAAAETWNRKLENDFRTRLEDQMIGSGPTDSPGCSPAELNGAVMQLGQLVCTPSSPSCSECPLRKICRAAEEGLQEEIPAGRKKEIIRKESRILVFIDKSKVLVSRRDSGIGRGLWFFPAADNADDPHGESPEGMSGWIHLGDLDRQIHTYTRYRETLLPGLYLLQQDAGAKNSSISPGCSDAGEWVDIAALAGLPMPTAYRRIADDLQLKLESLVRNVH